MADLTIKQKRFADEYIISGNASQAAIAAGYSKKYAAQNTDKLLKNTKVKSYIAERMAELDSKKIAKQEEVLAYLTSIMRGEQQEKTLVGEGMGEQRIADIDVSAKDRIKAAELIGKRYSMWTEKVDVSGGVVFITGDDEVAD